ncbi:MAG TPA: hypothetical protein VKY70_09440 [Pseudomonas sp.]|jgi:hypothetical protein|nr:hypothetical protein [Pseudomonas sp.]
MRHLSLFLLGALAGCAATPPQESGGSLAGHLVMAPRMQVFVPCHAQEPLWVVVDDALREQLFTRYAELVDEPGEEAFAQVRGTVGPALDCQWCRDFPGSFRLEAVLEYREASATDCR